MFYSLLLGLPSPNLHHPTFTDTCIQDPLLREALGAFKPQEPLQPILQPLTIRLLLEARRENGKEGGISEIFAEKDITVKPVQKSKSEEELASSRTTTFCPATLKAIQSGLLRVTEDGELEFAGEYSPPERELATPEDIEFSYPERPIEEKKKFSSAETGYLEAKLRAANKEVEDEERERLYGICLREMSDIYDGLVVLATEDEMRASELCAPFSDDNEEVYEFDEEESVQVKVEEEFQQVADTAIEEMCDLFEAYVMRNEVMEVKPLVESIKVPALASPAEIFEPRVDTSDEESRASFAEMHDLVVDLLRQLQEEYGSDEEQSIVEGSHGNSTPQTRVSSDPLYEYVNNVYTGAGSRHTSILRQESDFGPWQDPVAFSRGASSFGVIGQVVGVEEAIVPEEAWRPRVLSYGD